MYPNLKVAILKHSKRQRIIKVFGITRVNGKGKHSTHISAASNLFFLDSGIQLLCISLHFLRKLTGQAIFSQDGMYLSIMFPRLTENFLHYAIGRVRTRSPLGNTHQYLIPIFGTITILFGNKDVCIHTPISGYHKSKILLHLYHSNKGRTLTLYHLGNLPFELLTATWKDIHFHQIAM